MESSDQTTICFILGEGILYCFLLDRRALHARLSSKRQYKDCYAEQFGDSSALKDLTMSDSSRFSFDMYSVKHTSVLIEKCF